MQDRPTPLWTVQRDGKEVTCAARLAPYGIELDIAHDGTVVLTRVFETDIEALAWAEEKRLARTAQGWNDVAVDRDSDPIA
ncbi:MAG: hypothetical protein AB7N65_02065 [Vicinamibacterales bacterium]